MQLEHRQFNNRLIVLDTETTGLNPQEGHRIIEIGCVELVNRRLSGNRFHVYLNPDRLIDEGAIEVHGITNEFLQDKPHFHDIAHDLIEFIRGSELIIHNAPFDAGFINYEFSLISNELGTLGDYCNVFDTLSFARQKHPGQRNSLDALCKRYCIDNSHRELHGALLDAEILVDVFLMMTGGQASLLDEKDISATGVQRAEVSKRAPAERPPVAVIRCSEDELEAHDRRISDIEKASGACLWKMYF